MILLTSLKRVASIGRLHVALVLAQRCMPRATSAAAEYKFSNPHGYDLLRSILRPHLKYEPHDYQLEGVAKSLDGVHLVAVLATGAGKTAYFAMYMLVLQELSKNPNLCNPPKKVPKDPAMVVVYPTVNLEEEMVRFHS